MTLFLNGKDLILVQCWLVAFLGRQGRRNTHSV